MVFAAAGGRIVQAQHKIPGRRGPQPLFDHRPGGQQVGQGQDAEIMAQRRAQHGGPRQGGGDPGHHLHFHLGVAGGKLQQRGGHAVYPRISAAHQGGGAAPGSLFQGQGAPLQLLGHGGGQQFLARRQRGDQIQVHPVAADHIGLFQSGPGGLGHAIDPAGPQAHHIHFVHSVHFQSGPKALAATASVTPAPACFGTSRSPPCAPSTAARSHTLSTPTVWATKAEGVKRPGASRSWAAV